MARAGVAAHSSPSSLDDFWVDVDVDADALWVVDVAWLGRERL